MITMECSIGIEYGTAPLLIAVMGSREDTSLFSPENISAAFTFLRYTYNPYLLTAKTKQNDSN